MINVRNVFVIGTAMSKFGKMKESSREAISKTSLNAIHDAGIAPKEIDAAFYSNAFGVTENQLHLGPLINSAVGIPEKPSVTVESACSSSSAAMHEAFAHIASGMEDICLVAGGEKLSHLSTTTATTYFAMGSDYTYEALNGVTFPGLYAVMAIAHMEKFGTSEEMMASVAIKNHANALNNPLAHLQKKLTKEAYLESPIIAYPFHLYDCCPFSDGAAAVVLASEAKARELGGDEMVEVLASERGGTVATLQDREHMTGIGGAELAGRKAMKRAQLKPADIDVAEVHDCFTIAEIMATEDLGFFERGQGGKAAMDGVTSLGGDIPVNPSGGLKAKGHPVSATGAAQIHELYEQLLGKAGNRQVEGAETALAHNVGATGGSCTVHIMKRRR